jgi:hypothetical protein
MVSHREKHTRDFAAGKRRNALSGIELPSCLKPDRWGQLRHPVDLAVLPGNRFELLHGHRHV